MRALALPLVLTMVLAACEYLPPPPNQSRGYPAYDRSTRTLWLNGQEYYVPPSVNTVGLRRASMITLDWEQQGEQRVVVRYSIDEFEDSML